MWSCTSGPTRTWPIAPGGALSSGLIRAGRPTFPKSRPSWSSRKTESSTRRPFSSPCFERCSPQCRAEGSDMCRSTRTHPGAQLLVDALRLHGADTAFCVPGESYLAVIDVLYDAREAIRLVVARQDGGASYMAEAYGKTTGPPGICFVTRGPGAGNASPRP